MLCRWGRFRNLALRIHAGRLWAGRTRAGRLIRGVFGAVCGIASISPSHTSPSRTYHP
jgi:hypothetical protein